MHKFGCRSFITIWHNPTHMGSPCERSPVYTYIGKLRWRSRFRNHTGRSEARPSARLMDFAHYFWPFRVSIIFSSNCRVSERASVVGKTLWMKVCALNPHMFVGISRNMGHSLQFCDTHYQQKSHFNFSWRILTTPYF